MRELLSGGHDFSLFEAVELIERIAEEKGHRESRGDDDARGEFPRADSERMGADRTEARRAGAYLPPSREPIRFRAVRDMGFPAADIARISLEEAPDVAPEQTPGQPTSRYVIEATCLGLYGPDSPLPAYVNERIVARDRDATALRDFLDLFNHRILTLLCRIARRYRHIRVFDGGATDELSLLSGALIGERGPGVDPPECETRVHRLRNATRLGLFSLSARALEAIVSDRFGGIEVRVEEFVRRTVFICDEQRNRVGVRGNVLGESALLGDRVMSRTSKIRVWLGPFDSGRLHAFLPRGESRRTLDALLRRVLPAPLDYDVILRVSPDTAEPACLSRAGRLALDAWLGDVRHETALRFGAGA